jgi:septum formation protein
MPPDIDEKSVAAKLQNQDPIIHCTAIAQSKLNYLLQKTASDAQTIIMCFDTVVFFNGNILEKPATRQEALATVKQWGRKGSKLEVWTAVAIGVNSPPIRHIETQLATIFITRDLSDDEIPAYLDASGAMDSSGSVIIEHLTQMNAAYFEGELSCIQGFPIDADRQNIQQIKTKLNLS